MPASGSLDEKQGRRVCVGQIAGARGLKGEFFVRSFTADPHAVADYGPLSTEVGDRLLRIWVVGMTKNGLVVRAEGIDDRSAAEALQGTRLYVSRQALPPPAEDEFYHADLIGLEAELAGGDGAPLRRLGRVAAVHDFGAAPVLEIADTGSVPLMVPFSKEAVPEVDVAGGRIVVAPLPGLLGPDAEPGTDADASEVPRW
jgi:16S rRNA processing protein RimM